MKNWKFLNSRSLTSLSVVRSSNGRKPLSSKTFESRSTVVCAIDNRQLMNVLLVPKQRGTINSGDSGKNFSR